MYLLTTTVLVLRLTFVVCTEYEVLDDLQNSLLKGYSRNLRPVNQSSQTVSVSLHISLSRLADLDDVHELLVTWFDILMTWSDERLVWDSETTDSDVRTIIMPRDKVWVPDLYLLNAFGKNKGLIEGDDVIQVGRGGVSWYAKVESTTLCPLNMNRFPFDEHTCKITFTTRHSSAREVNITNVIFTENAKMNNGEWKIQSTSTENVLLDLGLNKSGFSITLRLRRNPQYYLYNLVLPMIVLIIVNPIVLLLKSSSGEKISVSVTIFLSFTVFITLLTSMLPKASVTVPNLVLYLYIHFQMSSDILVYCILKHRVSDVTLIRYFGWLSGRKRCSRVIKPKSEDDLGPQQDGGSIGDNSGNDVDVELIHSRLDIFFFGLYLTVILCLGIMLVYWNLS